MNGSPIFKVQKNKEKIYNIENIKIYLSWLASIHF